MDGYRPHAEGRLRRPQGQADRAAVQALSVGMDVPRAVRRVPRGLARRAVSSRRGRRSSPTRASCRCSGPCSRATPTCCRPFSTTIRRPPSSAIRSCASRSIRARAPMWRSWSRARRSIRTRAPTAPKASSARRSRPCRGMRETTQRSAPGSRPASPVAISVREDLSPITKNTSRFLPHAIVG